MLPHYHFTVPSRMLGSLDLKKTPKKGFISCKPPSQVIFKIDCKVLTWVLLQQTERQKAKPTCDTQQSLTDNLSWYNSNNRCFSRLSGYYLEKISHESDSLLSDYYLGNLATIIFPLFYYVFHSYQVLKLFKKNPFVTAFQK